MEGRCVPLQTLKPSLTNWFVKVLLIEKTPIRNTQKWGRQQRLVFIDEENTRMQSIIYDEDVDQLDKVLHLYRTYYVGNGKIKPLTGPILARSEYQIVLNKSCYIRPTPKELELSLTQVYEITPFVECPQFEDDSDRQLNLLCGVIHVFPVRRAQKRDKLLQEFVIVNQECRPMILTFWDDFLHSEARILSDNVHKMPIILGMRLSTNTYHGLSLGVSYSSTILFDPPISETEQLRSWLKRNKDYVDLVLSEELYEKQNQATYKPLDRQIRKISQITSLSQMIKSFWIKANVRVTKIVQPFYHTTCPHCSKTCGAAYGLDSTCLHCNTSFLKPNVILRFEVELSDGSGTLNATIENREAEALLGMSADAVAQADVKGTAINADYINTKSQNLRQLIHIRTSSITGRGRSYTHYTVEAFLPTSATSASSSAFPALKEKGPSSATQKISLLDVSMTEEEEEITSSVQKPPVESDLSCYPSTLAAKRGFVSTLDSDQKKLKHAKQD